MESTDYKKIQFFTYFALCSCVWFQYLSLQFFSFWYFSCRALCISVMLILGDSNWYSGKCLDSTGSKCLSWSFFLFFLFESFSYFFVSCHWSLLVPPENIRKPLVFWWFQGVSKEISGMKWVNQNQKRSLQAI